MIFQSTCGPLLPSGRPKQPAGRNPLPGQDCVHCCHYQLWQRFSLGPGSGFVGRDAKTIGHAWCVQLPGFFGGQAWIRSVNWCNWNTLEHWRMDLPQELELQMIFLWNSGCFFTFNMLFLHGCSESGLCNGIDWCCMLSINIHVLATQSCPMSTGGGYSFICAF